MTSDSGPYRVVQVSTPEGPGWRLVGPGLGEHAGRAYPWQEVREKLVDLAELMNFAWAQGRQQQERSASQ